MDTTVQVALITVLLGPGSLFVILLSRRGRDGDAVSKEEVVAIDAAASLGIINAYSRMASSKISQLEDDLGEERRARQKLEREVGRERGERLALQDEVNEMREAWARIGRAVRRAGQAILTWIDEGATPPAPTDDVEELREALDQLPD